MQYCSELRDEVRYCWILFCIARFCLVKVGGVRCYSRMLDFVHCCSHWFSDLWCYSDHAVWMVVLCWSALLRVALHCRVLSVADQYSSLLFVFVRASGALLSGVKCCSALCSSTLFRSLVFWCDTWKKISLNNLCISLDFI